MSMFTAEMMAHDSLVNYLKKAGIGKQAQIKVLRLIWETEKDGWEPPRVLKKRLDNLTRNKVFTGK